MKKRSIRLIIALMTIALLGVMAMQFYFLRQSYQMQSELFDQSVNEALNSVSSKVAKQDAVNFLNAKAQAKENTNKTTYKKAISKTTVITPQAIKTDKKNSIRQKKLALLRDSLQRMLNHQKMDDEMAAFNPEGSFNFRIRVEEFTDEFGYIHGRLIPELVKREPILPKKISKYDTLHYVYLDPQFGKQTISVPRLNPIWVRQQQRAKKEKQMQQVRKLLAIDSLQNIPKSNSKQITVIENLAEEYRKSDEPLTKRINRFWIDSLLRFELRNRGIFLPFSYEVLTAHGDSLIFSNALSTAEKPQFMEAGTYQIPIFSNEVINDPGKLKIFFPQKNSLILNQMGASMITTAGLLLILIFCFGYTIFSIIKQKKISEMKLDFINNMTHEFKTPVSTIMIASEALKDKEMTVDKSRISRLANIIYEENVRLGSHIERVLNIARLEKDDFKLETKPIDVNELITVVLDSMSLILQKSNAQATLHLDAENSVIVADDLHFANVLYNLIDNAVKYSETDPDITISTLNHQQNLLIRVKDNGIGMGKEQQNKIFEQFYRIPTGNIHNVKGFGLGLSYVNTIVKKLNGTITVKSEKDKGSEFELKLPLA